MSAEPDGTPEDSIKSVQSSSLLTVCIPRLDFYVMLRKLIPKLQAFSKSIQETSMVRFYSSIYADDKMLIRQMSCDSAFHGIPHQIAAAHRAKTECFGSVPHALQSNVILVRNLPYLVQPCGIWPFCRRNATALWQHCLIFVGRQNFLNTHLIHQVVAFQIG
jgi:hypothetical protein